MENFEKIEEYIAGKMNGLEKESFEKAIESDPSLKSEVAMQKAIVDAVKNARMAELKGILSQVPVTGIEASLGISVTKIAAIIASAAVLVTASVFYINQREQKVQSKKIKDSILEKIEIPASDLPAITPNEDVKPADSADKSIPQIENKNTISEKNKIPASIKKVDQPKIDLIDPTKELTTDNAISNSKSGGNAPMIAASHIPVETHENDKKYSFHYQFSDGKLMLYGLFDKGLYEVIEVNGNTHTMFLYYKDGYYQLNDKSKLITPLVSIKDAELIAKLNEFRSR